MRFPISVTANTRNAAEMTFNWTSFLTNSTLQVVKLGTGDRPKYGDNCLVQCVFIQKPVQEEIQGNSLSPLKFWLPLGRGFVRFSRRTDE